MKRFTHLLCFGLLWPLVSLGQDAFETIPNQTGFVPNHGQITNQAGLPNPEVAYLWDSRKGLNVQLRSDGFAYDTYAPDGAGNWAIHRLDVRFVDASPHVTLTGLDQSTTATHHYDPYRKVQASNVRACRKVVYEGLYEGIDLHAEIVDVDGQPHFKYDFVVAPGADHSQIVMEYAGHDSAEMHGDKIEFSLSGRSLREEIPESYTSHGRSLDVTYRSMGTVGNRLMAGLELPADADIQNDEALTIDPIAVVEWATYYGDSLEDVGHAIVIDTLGIVFVAGATQSLQHMASNGAHQSSYNGGQYDAFIARYNQHGLRQWATYYGGSGSDEGLGVAIGNFYDLYLVGRTTSPDSIGNDTSYQPENAGGQDGFIAQFDRMGLLNWDTFLGGPGDDEVVACATFHNGKLLVAGNTESTAFTLKDSLPVTFSEPYSGGGDAFLARFTANGELEWATCLGGPDADVASAVGISTDGFVTLGGHTQSASGLAWGNAFQNALQGETDGFLARYDAEGSKVWASYYGSEGNDHITGVASDTSDAFISGYTDTEIPYGDSLSHQAAHAGVLDAFAMRIDSLGAPLWFTHIGGDSLEMAHGIGLDRDGDPYIVGTTFSDTGIVAADTSALFGTEYQGNGDAFVMRFSRQGERIWGNYVGGPGLDKGHALVAYGFTAVFFTGSTSSESGIPEVLGHYSEIHQENYGGGPSDVLLGRVTQITSTPPANVEESTGGGGWGGGGSGGGNVGSPGPQPIGLCIGDSLQLAVAGGSLGLGAEWIWYADTCGATDLFIGEGPTVWVAPQVTSNFYVRAESIFHISACFKITVHVDTLPAATALVPDSVCAGDTAVLQADGAMNYHWAGPNDFESDLQVTEIDSVALDQAGVYTVTVSTQFGCSDTASISLTVLPSPVPAVSMSDVTCIGFGDGSATIASADSSEFDVLWLHDQSTSPVLTDLEPGTYTYLLTSPNGCTTSDTIAIQEPVFPVDSVSVMHAECDNSEGSITLHMNGFTGPYEFIWSPEEMEGNPLTQIPGGAHTAAITDANGCLYTQDATVGNFGFFEVELPDSIYLDLGEATVLQPVVIPPAEDLSYVWTPDFALSCALCENPEADPPNDTTYVVTVTSPAGCTAQDSIFVERERVLSRPFIPNIFSPNGDGLNDELCVLSDRIERLHLQIYNRWGDKVFESREQQNCWDGTFDGAPVANGAYVYHLQVALDDGELFIDSGNLNVIR